MENPEQEIYASREHKQSRYDKRLILKIVKEVENGLPKKEANRIYGLGKASLDGWMQYYVAPNYQQTSIGNVIQTYRNAPSILRSRKAG